MLCRALVATTYDIDMANSHVHVGGAAAGSSKMVATTRFKAECLRIIEQMARDHEPVTITRRGRPVAVIVPVVDADPGSIIGALKGSVLRYDDPFAPAVGAGDWNATGRSPDHRHGAPYRLSAPDERPGHPEVRRGRARFGQGRGPLG
jgi:prevent-host-death family protein